MTIEWFIVLLAGLFAIGLTARTLQNRRRQGTRPAVAEDESQLDFNEKFLRLKRGEPTIGLVRTLNQADNLSIRAMLDAEGVPSYCDDNSMGNLYAGISVEGFADAVIMVYQGDREIAREIVQAFIDERKKDLEQGQQPKQSDRPPPGGNQMPRVLPELMD